jgi:hypothetical protein
LLFDAAIEGVADDKSRSLEAVLLTAKAAERCGKFRAEHNTAELMIVAYLRAAEAGKDLNEQALPWNRVYVGGEPKAVTFQPQWMEIRFVKEAFPSGEPALNRALRPPSARSAPIFRGRFS